VRRGNSYVIFFRLIGSVVARGYYFPENRKQTTLIVQIARSIRASRRSG